MNPRTKIIAFVLVIAAALFILLRPQTPTQVTQSVAPATSNLTQLYSNSKDGFSIRLPNGYTVDDAYQYQLLGPGKEIPGVKFTIPAPMATGTNLSPDTYISVETLSTTKECQSGLFVDNGVIGLNDGVAYSSGAAAGNDYIEQVYTLKDTHPCLAVRYFIHFANFENYPPGTVRRIDPGTLITEFDAIRRTLVVGQ